MRRAAAGCKWRVMSGEWLAAAWCAVRTAPPFHQQRRRNHQPLTTNHLPLGAAAAPAAVNHLYIWFLWTD